MRTIAIAFLLFISNCVYSQDVKRFLSEGLVLAYFLGTKQFENIEDYINLNGFKYDYKQSSDGFKVYLKTNQDLTEVWNLTIDTREDGRIAIGIILNEKDPLFFQKIKRELSSNNLFKFIPDGEFYSFFVPKKDPPKNAKDVTEIMDYLAIISVDKSKELIYFYTPGTFDKYLKWEYYIPKLFK